jgi:hypothetical protein
MPVWTTFLASAIAVAAVFMVETGDAQQTRCCTDEVIVVTGRSGPTHVNDPDYMDRNNPFEAPGGVAAKKPNPLDDPQYGVCVMKGQTCVDYQASVHLRSRVSCRIFAPCPCHVIAAEALVACEGGSAQ